MGFLLSVSNFIVLHSITLQNKTCKPAGGAKKGRVSEFSKSLWLHPCNDRVPILISAAPLQVSDSWPVYPCGLITKPVNLGDKRWFHWSQDICKTALNGHNNKRNSRAQPYVHLNKSRVILVLSVHMWAEVNAKHS